jgi:tetratricopeptide (TPR) repeat protein
MSKMKIPAQGFLRFALTFCPAVVTCCTANGQGCPAPWANAKAVYGTITLQGSGTTRDAVGISTQAANEGAAEAERVVLAAAAKGPGPSCAGQVLTDLASIALASGRLDDAASLAERAIRVLQQEHLPNDPILLRPLNFIAYIRLEHGETAKAREIFHRMQSIRSERVEDQMLVHAMAASLAGIEGRYREAESEYIAGLTALEGAGLGNAIDAGDIFTALGGLYIKEHRLDDARLALDRAFAISNSAAEAGRLDRMKVLLVRGVLLARRRAWAQAERDLHDALAIADDEPRLDPDILWSLLVNYAQVLRKNHHSGEARSIEMRAVALHRQAQANATVDVTELAGKAALKK